MTERASTRPGRRRRHRAYALESQLLAVCEQIGSGELPPWRGALRIARGARTAGVALQEPYRTFVALDEAWNADYSAHPRLTEAILSAARAVLSRH